MHACMHIYMYMYVYVFIYPFIYLFTCVFRMHLYSLLFVYLMCMFTYMWGFTGTVRALQEFYRDPILPEVQGFDLGFQVSLKYALKIMGRSM